MYADVVVDAPSDPKIPFFTYRVPENMTKDIEIGQIIFVPFGQKNVWGYVIELKKEAEIEEAKDVLSILSPVPVILPKYIKLLRWISWYYRAPMIDVVKLALPTFSQKFLSEIGTSKPKKEGQTLLIFPSKYHIGQFNQKASKGILEYHHELSPKEKRTAWVKIYRGEVETVVGLRSAIFAPCPNLTDIHIFGEEDQTYFEERSPYYNVVKIARKLSQIASARLFIYSEAPRVETNYHFQVKTDKSNHRIKTSIVSLIDELKSGNRSPVSRKLKESLKKITDKNGEALVFLNRLREQGQVYCYECKFSGFSPAPPQTCPNCKSVRIRFYTLNLKNIAEIIGKIFPQTQLELVAEGEQKIIRPGKKGGVFLATNSILYRRDLKFALLGMISADTILNFPDYRSAESAFSTIRNLKNLLLKNGEFIIQTYNPTHPAITLSLKDDYRTFYNLELAERKKLAYPPFATLAKLTISQKRKKTAEEKAQRVFNKLLYAGEKHPILEISPPRETFGLRPKFAYTIILKSKKRENLDPFLEIVQADFKIEVDPKELW